MCQQISKPTRITHKSKTLLDHIWVSQNCNIGESTTTTGISDHHGVFVEIVAPMQETDTKLRIRSYKNYDKEQLIKEYREEIGKSDLSSLIDEQKTDEAIFLWIKLVSSLCDKHAPEKEVTIKTKTEGIPWYSDEVLSAIAARTIALDYDRKKGNSTSKNFLRRATNKLKYLKRKLKRSYFHDKVEEQKDDPKKLWNILKEVSHTQQYVEEIFPDPINSKVVDSFKLYFAGVGKNIQNQLCVSFSFEPNGNHEGFHFKNVKVDDVKKLIDRIKTKVATGNDRIPSRIIKDLKHEASPDLAKLINLSYSTSTFPSKLKHAIIRAIYKNKGNPNEPEFYRPISVLSVISKIFERSATDQIVEYLETTSQFYKNQHAYRRKHSTTTCLVEVTDFIHTNLDSGLMVGLVSTDLSKAFDTLSHSLLLTKLQKLGFSTNAIDWIKSYLSNRTQQVSMNGLVSSTKTVEAGVPQGSILGPVLFIVFTSNFHEHFPDHKITAFADDTQILVTGHSSDEIKMKAETAIENAQRWFTANSLKINPTKSEVMIFSGKRKTEDVLIQVQDGNDIKWIKTTRSMKILGVIVDDQLSWKNHISKIKQRTHTTITNLARTTHVLPLKSRKILYDALVAPHFNYCDIIWDGTSTTQANTLQKTANFAARSLLGAKKKGHPHQRHYRN